MLEAPQAISPRAFSERLRQLCGKGFKEYEFADPSGIRGAGWNCFFLTETDPYGGINNRHEVCACTVATMTGAWRECEDGLFCGNREEVAGIVGEATVAAWERAVEEGMNG